MGRIRSLLLDEAIVRLVGLPPEEQDRIAIEILADLCDEEEWVLVASSEPYQRWLAAQPASAAKNMRASVSNPAA